MQHRWRYSKAYPDAYKAMLAPTQAVARTDLAPQLIDLGNFRVSQLNGCAFCLDMHSKDLRARTALYQNSAIQDQRGARGAASLQRARARCAGMGGVQQVPDAVYDTVSRQFSEAELTQLTLAIVAINGWNRFNVAFHTPAGNYKSGIVSKTG